MNITKKDIIIDYMSNVLPRKVMNKHLNKSEHLDIPDLLISLKNPIFTQDIKEVHKTDSAAQSAEELIGKVQVNLSKINN